VSHGHGGVTDALVLATDVARTFGSGQSAVVAVHGASCLVRAGDLIALTGPSGSGKTTLMHLLAGLDAPTAGTIQWPAIGTRDHLRPGPVAIVFQAPSLLAPLDILENVSLPLLLQGIDRDTAREMAIEALRKLDLESLSAKLPEEISGGQAQRVAVARALAGQPRLIMADEPTGQLDHTNGAVVVNALIAASTASGAALIVNTHDAAVADRLELLWSMTNGRLITGAAASC
jgi:ABC-type lipoprotein export system ATPase subunit